MHNMIELVTGLMLSNSTFFCEKKGTLEYLIIEQVRIIEQGGNLWKLNKRTGFNNWTGYSQITKLQYMKFTILAQINNRTGSKKIEQGGFFQKLNNPTCAIIRYSRVHSQKFYHVWKVWNMNKLPKFV